MMNGNTEQPAAMGNREDEVTLLVGMGFERKKAKRAMEANNGLIDQAIIDLTSGVTFDAPQTTSRRDTMGSDAGLNSLPVPQRRLEPDEDERHRSHRERKSKKKKRRRREHTGERGISTTSDSTPSPATATRDFMEPPASPSRQPFNARMISQFDATSPGHRPAAPRRFGSMGNASLNAPSSQQNEALERNGFSPSQEENVEDASFNVPEEFASWPSTSGMWPTNTNQEPAPMITPSSPNALDSSDSRLRNAPSSQGTMVTPSRPNTPSGPVSLQSRRSQGSASAFYHSGVVYDESEYMSGNPNSVPTVPVEAVYDEADDNVDMEAPANRSPPMARNENGSKRDVSWRKPVNGIGLLVLVCVILVIPAIFVLAIVLPIALAPEPTEFNLNDTILYLLGNASLDRGAALQNSGSAQNEAYQWLIKNEGINNYGEMQIKQRYALATLYFSTGGNNWKNNDGWIGSEEGDSECSSWFYRYTNAFCTRGAVSELDLSNNNLVGIVPFDELSFLSKSLQALTLDSNSLSGIIPTSISLLTNLVQLSLSRNQLQGTVPPQLFKNMTKLDYLYLYDNNLEVEISCKNITYCYISCDNSSDSCRSL